MNELAVHYCQNIDIINIEYNEWSSLILSQTVKFSRIFLRVQMVALRVKIFDYFFVHFAQMARSNKIRFIGSRNLENIFTYTMHDKQKMIHFINKRNIQCVKIYSYSYLLSEIRAISSIFWQNDTANKWDYARRQYASTE